MTGLPKIGNRNKVKASPALVSNKHLVSAVTSLLRDTDDLI